MIKLGEKYRDQVTGFTGIVTGRASYLTGCDQYLLVPKVKKNREAIDGKYFDEGRLMRIGAGINKKEVMGEKNGADMMAPIK